MPGKQPLQFYLCSNQFDEEVERLPLKQNWISMIILALCVLSYISVSLKVRHFKKKQTQTVAPLNNAEHNQIGNIAFVEQKSLSDYVTTMSAILGSSIFLVTLFVVNKINPLTLSLVSSRPKLLSVTYGLLSDTCFGVKLLHMLNPFQLAKYIYTENWVK